MTLPARSPLDAWIHDKIGLCPDHPLTPENLNQYQLKKVRETLAHVQQNSPFYRRRLKNIPEGFPDQLSDLARLPFTTADDIRRDPLEFLCVSRSQVARTVTLRSSGTMDRPKRLFFTEADLELTVDFFHHGMSALVHPGQRVLILMPGELPGSVGDLLVKALARINVTGIVHGPVRDPGKTIRELMALEIDGLVGLPVQLLGLVRHPAGVGIPKGRISSVLLSADYVPDSVVAVIREKWESRVFQHYGMTEMGLGGGVECAAFFGYHLREADLLFEIIHPKTGEPVSDGIQGEIVFTTLTRQGMPIVRYRTGDIASWIPGPCPCGSILRRMGKIRGRLKNETIVDEAVAVALPVLDEAVFAIPGVTDFRAEIRSWKGKDHVWIALEDPSSDSLMAVYHTLRRLPSLRTLAEDGRLTVFHSRGPQKTPPASTSIKRRIIDYRKESDPT